MQTERNYRLRHRWHQPNTRVYFRVTVSQWAAAAYFTRDILSEFYIYYFFLGLILQDWLSTKHIYIENMGIYPSEVNDNEKSGISGINSLYNSVSHWTRIEWNNKLK